MSTPCQACEEAAADRRCAGCPSRLPEKLRGQEKNANVRAAFLSAFNTTRLIGMQRLPNNYRPIAPCSTAVRL